MTDFSGNANDDRRLLRLYAEQGDQASFRILVERYSGLVYGTAMRKTGKPEWAADITQNVLLSLGRKAPRLSTGGIPSVGAWLHRAATLESRRVLRDQIKIQRRDEMLRKELTGNPAGLTPEVREKIASELDEALEKLPSGDRDILMLHYFDGLRFAEIAGRLGLKAEAVQKRSVRALEKLSRLLRGRGELVPTAVLAGLLSSELAESPPFPLVTRILNTAATTPSLGGNTTILAMTAFSKSSISGLAAALVLLASFFGGGYLVGSAKSSGAPSGITVAAPPAAPPAPPPATAAKPALPASASVEKPVPVEAKPEETEDSIRTAAERLQQLGAEREKLMADLKARFRAGTGFEELRPDLARIEKIDQESEKALAALGEDFRKLLDSIQAMPEDKTKEWLTGLFFKHWGKLDPAAALEVARGLGTPAIRGAYRGWGAAAPEEALVHQRSIAEGDQAAGRDALLRIFDGWVSEDPAAAMKGLGTLPFDDQKTAFKAFDDALQAESLRPEVLKAAAGLQDEALRADLARNFCTHWGRVAPDAAMAWLDAVEFENPRAALPAAKELVKAKVQTGKAEEGVNWIWAKLPADLKEEFVSEFVVGEWAKKDRQGAATWLQSNHPQRSLENR